MLDHDPIVAPRSSWLENDYLVMETYKAKRLLMDAICNALLDEDYGLLRQFVDAVEVINSI